MDNETWNAMSMEQQDTYLAATGRERKTPPISKVPIVTSKKHIVGTIAFNPVEVEITGKNDEGVYWGPGVALHPTMMTGEVRNPIILTPEMVLPVIAQLSHWAALIQGNSELSPNPVPVTAPGSQEVPGGAATVQVDPLARIPGESREAWDARLRYMAHQAQTEEQG